MFASADVPMYGLFELGLRASTENANPYLAIQATAAIERPDGSSVSAPLFWRGGQRWGMRLSPDRVGTWRYQVSSTDPGLNGLAGAFECLPSNRRGGLTVMPNYPSHFAYQDGTPCWLMGDTAWRAFASDSAKSLDRDAVLHYLDVRAEQGFGYVHVDLMGGGGIDGQQKVMFDFGQETLNPAFFDEVDLRLGHMNARGLTCGLVLAWSRGAESWESFASDEARLRFTRYLVGRYSAYNVIFVVSGEWDLLGEGARGSYNAIGGEIMRWDPHGRLRAIHAGRRRTVQEFNTEPWMSLGDYQQMYRAPNEREATAAERASLRNRLIIAKVHGKPVINGEYGYYLRQMGRDHSYHRQTISGVDKPHSHTRSSFRRASWALAMAGGYFVTGFGTTYFGGWRDLGPFDVDAPKNDAAEADLTHIRRFFLDTEWWKLSVMDALISAPQGVAYCLAELSRTYLVYCEGTTRLELTLDGDEDESYTIQRYDPRTGLYVDLGSAAGSDLVPLVCPDKGDWAFVARRDEGEA